MRNSSFNRNGKAPQGKASLASPMARELGRWIARSPVRHRRDRWSQWARGLAARHRAIIRFGSPASLTFLDLRTESSVVTRIIRQRWISSINLYPTLRLSVQHLIEKLPGFSAQNTFLRTEVIRAGPASQAASSRSGQIPIFKQWPSALERASDPAKRNYSIAQFDLGRRARTGGFDQEIASSASLDRVFRRLQGTDEFSVGHVRTARVQETLQVIARRIIQSTQRLEERNGRSAVPPPPFAFKQTARWKETTPENDSSENPGDPGAREMSMRNGPPLIDVDDLTEKVIHQIDQRATAWRERMGRI
jgi:hypothetical protein